jgi:hypothetical protein
MTGFPWTDPPCTCEECRPGPGIDYASTHLSRMLNRLDEERAQRAVEITAWIDGCHGNPVIKKEPS